MPVFIVKNSTFPMLPPGMNIAKEKKPFHKNRNIRNDHHPHTGHIATKSDITATNPTTAPIDTNLGLYSSIFLAYEI